MKEHLLKYIEKEPPTEINVECKKNDGKARAVINLSIKDNQIVHVRHKTTAKKRGMHLNLYTKK